MFFSLNTMISFYTFIKPYTHFFRPALVGCEYCFCKVFATLNKRKIICSSKPKLHEIVRARI